MEEETESKSRFLSEEEAGRLVAEEDKEQFVNDLYCLRAGLSVIAERAEEVRNRAEKIEVDRIEKKKKLLIENGCMRSFQEDSYAQEFGISEEQVMSTRRKAKKDRRAYITFTVLIPLFLVGACLAAYFCYYFYTIDPPKGKILRLILCVIPVLFGLIVGVLFIPGAFAERREGGRFFSVLAIGFGGVILAAFHCYRIYRLAVSNWRLVVCGISVLIGLGGIIGFIVGAIKLGRKTKRSSLDLRRTEIVFAGLKEIGRETAEERRKAEQLDAPLKAECSVIYAILAARFGKKLDERDWKHLDLVIFYMETGRADNKKEALQLVEQQIQTDQITGAIEKATERLEAAVARAASAICSRLNRVCSQLDRIAELQSKELRISATQLYVSLANNSNISSRDLMDMVSYVLG